MYLFGPNDAIYMPKQKNVETPNNLEGIKSDFITVASHQLRTPIAAIRWSLDTLLAGRAGKVSPKQIEVIKEAYQNNNFMVKVVNDLLRVSRIEEKGLNLLPQHINLEKIVKESIKKYGEFIAAYNCKISQAASNPPKAYMDPLQMATIADALIDNAIRYSQTKGKININIKKARNYLLLKIQDNGIGIPLDQQQLVFSKFFRARNAMRAQTEGLGLDLYIAKKIIEASGGKIEFKSMENKGTVFNVYLPLEKYQFDNISKQKEEDPDEILKKEREFVSITVHELKAPLGITKWSLEILQSGKPGKLTKDQLELISQVYRGNERLLTLVRDLLNLSKLQEGKFEIDPKPIQFEEVIADVINGFMVQAKGKKIAIDRPIIKPPLPKIMADPNRVAQVVTNLVSNAIKYTPEQGKVFLSLKKYTGPALKKIDKSLSTADITHTENKKGYLVLAVKDTGIGISEEDQKKLFTRFFRSKKVLKTEAEGTGLGLYITKSIINLHGGDIWFTSQLGKGSVFYFSLPLA